MVITTTQKGILIDLPNINSIANACNLAFLYSPCKPPVTEVVYVEQTTSIPVARDPESTANWMQTLNFTSSTGNRGSGHSGDHHSLLPNSADSVKSSFSTGSGGSGDPLIQSSPAGSSHLVYAHLNMKQTQIQPPSNDDPVQYAQIAHQDKL